MSQSPGRERLRALVLSCGLFAAGIVGEYCVPLACADVRASGFADNVERAAARPTIGAAPTARGPREFVQVDEPQLEPARPPKHHPGWYDRDEETVEQHKPINQLRARILLPEGDLPIDFATPHFARYPTFLHDLGTTRGFSGTSWSWEPTALCFNPLWFQDINLERYGWHYGCAQTAVSAVKFTAECALLPYKLVAESPCDCQHTLGYDRPGNCVPYRCYRLPWRSDAALFFGGVATGLFFLAP